LIHRLISYNRAAGKHWSCSETSVSEQLPLKKYFCSSAPKLLGAERKNARLVRQLTEVSHKSINKSQLFGVIVKNRLTAFVLFLLLGGIFTSCEKQKSGLTITDGVLSVGLEIGYPPMEYYDTDVTLTGFDIDLTKALAEKLQLKIKYIDTSWEGIFVGLDTGKYDIAVNVTILPQRQRNYNFTRPYIGSSITITALKDSPKKIKKPEDIEGYRIAYQGDTTAQYFAEKLVSQGITVTAFSYDKIINCFDDLKLDRVDFVIADNIAAFYYAGKDNSPFEVVWQGPHNEGIGICLKKGNDALTNALNDALEKLFADGVMLNIFGRDLVSSVLAEFEQD